MLTKGERMRGGDDGVDPEDDTLGRPACVFCDCRLDDRALFAYCSGSAGLGGISTSVALDMLECETDVRSPPVARSSTLGRRFFAVSGSCSTLDRGVVELGRD